jgi:hypothetical protein
LPDGQESKNPSYKPFAEGYRRRRRSHNIEVATGSNHQSASVNLAAALSGIRVSPQFHCQQPERRFPAVNDGDFKLGRTDLTPTAGGTTYASSNQVAGCRQDGRILAAAVSAASLR